MRIAIDRNIPLAATVLAIFIVPVLFVVIAEVGHGKTRQHV